MKTMKWYESRIDNLYRDIEFGIAKNTEETRAKIEQYEAALNRLEEEAINASDYEEAEMESEWASMANAYAEEW